MNHRVSFVPKWVAVCTGGPTFESQFFANREAGEAWCRAEVKKFPGLSWTLYQLGKGIFIKAG